MQFHEKIPIYLISGVFLPGPTSLQFSDLLVDKTIELGRSDDTSIIFFTNQTTYVVCGQKNMRLW